MSRHVGLGGLQAPIYSESIQIYSKSLMASHPLYRTGSQSKPGRRIFIEFELKVIASRSGSAIYVRPCTVLGMQMQRDCIAYRISPHQHQGPHQDLAKSSRSFTASHKSDQIELESARIDIISPSTVISNFLVIFPTLTISAKAPKDSVYSRHQPPPPPSTSLTTRPRTSVGNI